VAIGVSRTSTEQERKYTWLQFIPPRVTFDARARGVTAHVGHEYSLLTIGCSLLYTSLNTLDDGNRHIACRRAKDDCEVVLNYTYVR